MDCCHRVLVANCSVLRAHESKTPPSGLYFWWLVWIHRVDADRNCGWRWTLFTGMQCTSRSAGATPLIELSVGVSCIDHVNKISYHTETTQAVYHSKMYYSVCPNIILLVYTLSICISQLTFLLFWPQVTLNILFTNHAVYKIIRKNLCCSKALTIKDIPN